MSKLREEMIRAMKLRNFSAFPAEWEDQNVLAN